jgi:3-oxoacyl-(acyl-carrier-protein) synthase
MSPDVDIPESRIVVTGMDVIAPLGASLTEVWPRVLRGESGIAPLHRFDPDGFPCTASAEVPEFDIASRMRVPKNEKFMGLSTRCAVRAAQGAVASSGVDLSAIDPYRIALYAGSGQTGLESSEFFATLEISRGATEEEDFANMGGRPSRLMDRYWSLRTLSNAGLGLLSVEFGAKGPSDNYVQGDTASALAIAAGFHDLRDGRSDVAIVGGYDSLLTTSTYLAYHNAGLLSSMAPARAYRPFDRDRDGIVLGEGAAFLVLERAEDARRRGAAVLGEILSVGDATEPDDTLDAKASGAALRAAVETATGGRPFDFVVAHGIGTERGDRDEAGLLDAVVGRSVPVTAFKGQTGYLGAATAAVELVLALQAARDRLVPPIARHQETDESCRLSLVTRTPHRLSAERPTALCVAWSWFGHCSAIAVRASGPLD